jgi:dihydrofolate reductase
MRKVVVGTFLTLDGVMQAPGGPDEDREGGFQHGGWSVSYWDDLMGQIIVASTLRAGALLLGRKTYEIFAAHWPNVSDEDPVGAKLNSVRKYVASRTLKDLTWKNSALITGDVVAGVHQLKQEPGDEIQVHGSGDLTQTLLRHGVVDELRLWVFPIALGTGKRLFGDGTMPSAFKLVGSKTSTTGVVISTYEAAGAVAYGSFEVDKRGRTEALWRDDQRGPATR